MSACDPGEEFWDNLARQHEFLDPDAEDAWAHENEEFVDEGDDSSASGTTDLQADGSFGLSFAQITTEQTDHDLPDAFAYDTLKVSVCTKKSTFMLVTNLVF
jgi:hypothetical protein